MKSLIQAIAYHNFNFHNTETTGNGVKKTVVCPILSYIKEPLQLIEKSRLCSGGSRFPL